jgi:hypothetical protein
MFVNSSGPLPGMDFAFPDTCITPIPSPVGPIPTPLPYPNSTLAPTAIPTQFKTLLMCMPAHNLTTTKVPSLGDQPGLLLGVASGMVMGPQRHMMGSTNLFIGGPPCTKMLSPGGHNGMSPNIPGLTIAPSQIKLMSLR